MLRHTLRLIVIAAAVATIVYAGFAFYGGATQTEAAALSDSVELAENQAGSMGHALNDVSAFASLRDPAGSQPQPGSSATAATTDIHELLARWEPRYNNAKAAYPKLESAITVAKSSAADYFAAQRAITGRINDPDAKLRAQQDDERDWDLYRQWEERADAVLAEAYAIGLRLDDMDAGLRKLELRAGFAFDASSFSEVPTAIADLNRELADFQAASENIRAVTKSPFEE
ncbi:MAG: hypothetical protein F4X66_05965 [Chloroflexi bacterium]|nr:hypothetical protein [Chloroflexota bacterium]